MRFQLHRIFESLLQRADRWDLFAASAQTGDQSTFSLERLLDWKEFDAAAFDSTDDTGLWEQEVDSTEGMWSAETCIPLGGKR